LTSAHGRYDIRIFHKECRSLARAGYDTSLVVADGKGEETAEDGVRIVDVGRLEGRLNRMVRSAWRVGRAGLALDADLYHFHDPELIPVALWLKIRGCRVVFDAHEDVPKQVIGKAYLHPLARRAIAVGFGLFEALAIRALDAVVGATPSITDKFARLCARVANVNNYPLLGELDSGGGWSGKRRQICYIGGISEARGIIPLLEALAMTGPEIRLELAGEFSEREVARRAHALPGWSRVDARGFLDRTGVREVLGRSMAGMVTLLPLPNHVEALPIKMFEYMAAGIPVIASDFPLWRQIVGDHNCGLLVDPADPVAIAAAVERLLADPDEAERMGRNGQNAVDAVFNWGIEERKLLALYKDILGS
jgi:glycosyltransferase involved in cell wall biosynthesis